MEYQEAFAAMLEALIDTEIALYEGGSERRDSALAKKTHAAIEKADAVQL